MSVKLTPQLDIGSSKTGQYLQSMFLAIVSLGVLIGPRGRDTVAARATSPPTLRLSGVRLSTPQADIRRRLSSMSLVSDPDERISPDVLGELSDM